jgi:hypothetical protein
MARASFPMLGKAHALDHVALYFNYRSKLGHIIHHGRGRNARTSYIYPEDSVFAESFIRVQMTVIRVSRAGKLLYFRQTYPWELRGPLNLTCIALPTHSDTCPGVVDPYVSKHCAVHGLLLSADRYRSEGRAVL